MKDKHILKNAVAAALMGCTCVQAAEFIVQTTGDTGSGMPTLISGDSYSIDTLRSAIEQADSLAFPGPDVIIFDSSITASSPAIITISTPGDSYASGFGGSSDSGFGINSDITITGPDQGFGLTLGGSGALRHFQINANGRLSLNHLTLVGGQAPDNTSGIGGAVLVLTDAALNVDHCTFGSNTARTGGAIQIGRYSLPSTISNSVFTSNATIEQADLFTASNGGAIDVEVEADLTLTNSTLSNNSSRVGGAVFAAGVIRIENSTLNNNSARLAGGAFFGNNLGYLTMVNSTVSANTADYSSGGLHLGIEDSGEIVVVNSTITGNIAAPNDPSPNRGGVSLNTRGGGVFIAENYNNVFLHNNIISNNTFTSAAVSNDVAGYVNALSSHNLIGVDSEVNNISDGVNGNQIGTLLQPLDAMLGALANNGGVTRTHALLPGSPAINGGNDTEANNQGLTTDQRGAGFNRFYGTAVDIGSFELDVDLIFENGFEQ